MYWIILWHDDQNGKVNQSEVFTQGFCLSNLFWILLPVQWFNDAKTHTPQCQGLFYYMHSIFFFQFQIYLSLSSIHLQNTGLFFMVQYKKLHDTFFCACRITILTLNYKCVTQFNKKNVGLQMGRIGAPWNF